MASGYFTGGTVSVSNGGTAVTGTGTAFTQVQAGGTFEANGLQVTIDAVTSNTALTLALPWPGTALSDEANYLVKRLADGAAIAVDNELKLGDLIDALSLKGALLTGEGPPSIGDGTDDDFWIDTTNADLYFKAVGAWGLPLASLKGDQGDSLELDAVGLAVARSTHDDAAALFTFMAEDTGQLSIKRSATSGDWSAWIDFQGPQGIQGDPGADGANGANGADGADGADWSTGAVPGAGVGADGDHHLATDGEVYAKVSGAWAGTGINLTGPVSTTPGPEGPRGESFVPSAEEPAANRVNYDTEADGFAFLATDTSQVSWKQSATSGDWSAWVDWGGGSGGGLYTADMAGTATAYTAAVSEITSLVDGVAFIGVVNLVSGVDATLNVSTLGAKKILHSGALGTVAGTMAAAQAALFRYDASADSGAGAWLLLNPVASKASVGLGNADNTSDADKPVSTATQAAIDAIPSGSPPFKNLIINGDMRVNQEGNKTGVTGGYICDLTKLNVSGAAVYDLTQVADGPPGLASCAEVKVATVDASLAAGDYTFLTWPFEGQHLQHIAKGTASAKPLVLSFWSKTNKAGTYAVELYDFDNDRLFSTAVVLAGGDAWEQIVISVPADTTGAFGDDVNLSLNVGFWLLAGSTFAGGSPASTWQANVNNQRANSINTNFADTIGNYMRITGIQLEVGDTATEFEHLPYDVQLQRVQHRYSHSTGTHRYYATISAQIMETAFNWPVTMAATPTVTVTPASGTNITTVSTFASSERGCRFFTSSVSAGDTFAVNQLVIADARL